MGLPEREVHKAGQVALALMAWVAGQLPAALLQPGCCESVIQRAGQERPLGEPGMRVVTGTTPAMTGWILHEVG